MPYLSIFSNFNTFINQRRGHYSNRVYSLPNIYMGGSTKSQKAGRLKRLEAKIVKKPASYSDYVET